MQALEWASAYPDRVRRVVAVIGGAEENAFLIGWLNLWAAPIRLDPDWNGGDYHGRAEPVRGLTEALKLVTLQANHWAWTDRMFGRAWAEEGKDPGTAMDHRFAVEAWLDRTAAARASLCDANHFLYLVKANQLFLTGHGGSLEAGLRAIQAPLLLIASADDLVFPPQRHLRALRTSSRPWASGSPTPRRSRPSSATWTASPTSPRPVTTRAISWLQASREAAQLEGTATTEKQAVPRGGGIFAPPRWDVCRALGLANLISATGMMTQGCARFGISHESLPPLAEDAMPTDMSAHQRPPMTQAPTRCHDPLRGVVHRYRAP